MTSWREEARTLLGSLEKRLALTRPTPTFQKVIVWLMVLVVLFGLVCLWTFR